MTSCFNRSSAPSSRLRGISSALLPISAALLLTACSGEPSSGDIEKVLQSGFAQFNTQMAAFAGRGAKVEVHSIKKLGCKADGSNAYVCDVEVDATNPMAGRTKNVSQLRLVKGSDGWMPSR
ncbi:MAG: hypothetical protein PGN26_15555 [Xylophilus ampelinus]